MKLVKETRKIWGYDKVQTAATCVRVPVMRAHAESINLEFHEAFPEAEAREVRRETQEQTHPHTLSRAHVLSLCPDSPTRSHARRSSTARRC